ncbi:NAD(P)-binding domain-containing protein [Limibacter armeniacum]|uniref:flavin-containing monooxygenase n=1 Tax=Limibacter armeniacum TaxID=466084 RepID=UPI002FE51A56
MKVCVIGAGCSGITAIKNLLQAGVTDITCYDQNDQVGGNWIYSENESHSSVCETTHLISSKTMSEYMDFPMPDHYPDYPSHRQVLAYFQSYAMHFGLLPYIQFNTKVSQVEKLEGQRWKVSLSTGEAQEFDYLFVSNGHHSVPRMPDLPGTFEGELLHSHQYKNSRPFKGKRVLVIGAGNSGCDCAVEISRVAAYVSISMRNPQYIVPKFFLGKPSDTFNEGLLWMPKPMAGFLRKISLKFQVGTYKQYGLPEPDYPVIAAHPTVNSELLYMIKHGKVHPKTGIEKIEGKKVWFKDGKSAIYDTIITATGYKIALPFFDKDFINYEVADRIPLFLRMFHPEHPTLLFIGLFQPQGAIWPLSDYQSKLAANYVTGKWQLPTTIQKLAEKDADIIEKEFRKSKRHTIEVHYHAFLKKLKKEIPKDAPAWVSNKKDKIDKELVTPITQSN